MTDTNPIRCVVCGERRKDDSWPRSERIEDCVHHHHPATLTVASSLRPSSGRTAIPAAGNTGAFHGEHPSEVSIIGIPIHG